MNNLIYYPGFEIKNVDWLKFALLYIDQLNPIIPKSGDSHLSDLHLKLAGETDLIDSHRPNTIEGELASLDAIEQIERVIRRPKSYEFVFGTNHFLEAWRKGDLHDYLLFKEKFSDDWQDFCVANQFGNPTDEGIRVHKDLAFIYMSLLAQIIAESRGISTITDHTSLDKFSVFNRRTESPTDKEITVAQAVINLELPADLATITLDQIISVRNRAGFKDRLRAFRSELETYLDSVETGKPGKFVASFDSIWKDYASDLSIAGLGLTTFCLGVWIAIVSPDPTLKLLKELVGGALVTVSGAVRIAATWKNTQSKRYTKKYLADLTTLEPVN